MKLRDKVETFLVKTGKSAKEILAIKAGVSPSTIAKIKNGRVPLPSNAYRLAVACGCGEEEALEIARECSSLAKDTA